MEKPKNWSDQVFNLSSSRYPWSVPKTLECFLCDSPPSFPQNILFNYLNLQKLIQLLHECLDTQPAERKFSLAHHCQAQPKPVFIVLLSHGFSCFRCVNQILKTSSKLQIFLLAFQCHQTRLIRQLQLQLCLTYRSAMSESILTWISHLN